MRTQHIHRLLIAFLVMGTLASCEDVITIDLDKGESQLAIDALILVDRGAQSIRLTKTADYFDNSTKAPGASGAFVRIESSLGQSFDFTEDLSNPGTYRNSTSIIGTTGEIFYLKIQYEGQGFTASSRLARTTLIDSLYQEERAAEFGNEAGKYLYFAARDSAGPGDYCWIKYSLNGQEDLRYNRLGAAFPVDAAFSPGNADGLDFIYPIRNSINGTKGYLVGDTLSVELLSIDSEQWRFLKEMEVQLNNTGLFANPMSNVRGNIFNADKNSKTAAVGCFGMARVSQAGVRIQ